MEEQIQQKSLDRWRFELRTMGKKHWLFFYSQMMNSQCSNAPRFYRALNLYGDWPVFEAIVESSSRELGSDPLAYVLKVAYEKWKAAQQQNDSESEYIESIERAKKVTLQRNEELARKLSGEAESSSSRVRSRKSG